MIKRANSAQDYNVTVPVFVGGYIIFDDELKANIKRYIPTEEFNSFDFDIPEIYPSKFSCKFCLDSN